MIYSDKNHINTFLIFLIVGLQVFSPVLFVPGGEAFGLSVFRLLVFSLGIFIYFKFGIVHNSDWEKTFLTVNTVLIIWLFFSIFWSENFSSGIKHVAYFSTILMLSYVFTYFVRFPNGFRTIALFISAIGLAIIFISFYEINTGVHLFRSSLQDVSELDRSLSYVTENQAWFTFGNPNDLAVHIAVCCFVTLMFSKSKIYSIIYFAMSFYIVNALDSRIVVIALIAFLMFYLLFYYQKIPSLIVKTAFASLLVGGFAFLVILSQASRVEFLDVSSFVRLQLITSAVDMARQSFLVGIGAGGFESEMWRGGYLARTIGITNPHNGFGRLLAENGIIGLSLFLVMLLLPLLIIRKARQDSGLIASVASATIVMPLLFSVGSDPLSSSSLQLAMAFLLVSATFAAASDSLPPEMGVDDASVLPNPY